jgi:protein SCO1
VSGPAKLLIAAAVAAILASACTRGDTAPGIVLRDDLGRRWDLRDHTGGIVLVFGYTHCEDTCPLMLSKLAKAKREGAPKTRAVEIAFVTVDPSRDTPRVLHAFVSSFGPGVVGLTGTSREVEKIERAYHVWAQRMPSKKGGYAYDEGHSSTMFFVDRSRNIDSLHDPTDSVRELARAMERL